MYSVVALVLALAGVFIWLGGLTYFSWQSREFFKSLFPRSGERDIRKKFEENLSDIEDFKKDLESVKLKVSSLESLALGHIQKIKVMRFNPYDDTGGDQSFAVALLDGKGTGVVVTSLHSRTGTRVFAKSVIEGKAEKHQFSKEEEKVVSEAMG